MNKENEKVDRDGEDMEARLWAYLDGDSGNTPEIEDLIAENNEWKEKYGELLEMFTLLKQSELEQPSLRFTKNVMEEISRYQIAPATKAYINKKIIWGIAGFFILLTTGFLIYGFAQVNWSAAGNAKHPLGIDLTAVDFSKMFSNAFVNGFMMLNILLGLLLLDRYLAVKRKAYRQNGRPA